MDNRIEHLENTILELGTELFKLKSTLTTITLQNESFMHMIKGLKNILDEKGLIASADFEEAVDLGIISDFLQKFNDPESDVAERLLKRKAH